MNPCRWLRPATGPISPPAKKPADALRGERLPDHPRVVVGPAVRRAEQVRAAAVAAEQQRPARRRTARPGAVQQGPQLDVGGVGVADLQAHRPPDADEVAHHEAARLALGAEDAAHQVLGLLGVLVGGDPEVEPGAGERLVGRGELGEHLLDAGERGGAGQLEQDVAGRPGHRHRRAHRAAPLADDGAAPRRRPAPRRRRRGRPPGRPAAAGSSPRRPAPRPARRRPAARRARRASGPRSRRRGSSTGRPAAPRPRRRRGARACPTTALPAVGLQHLEVERAQTCASGSAAAQTLTARRSSTPRRPREDPAGAAAEQGAGRHQGAHPLADRGDLLGRAAADEHRQQVGHLPAERRQRLRGRLAGRPQQVGVDREPVPVARHPPSVPPRPKGDPLPWLPARPGRTVEK